MDEAGYAAMRQATEAELALERAANDREFAPIVAELNELGYEVGTLSDLLQIGTVYKAAIPVLLKWLPRVHRQTVRDSIVRALTVPWAYPDAFRPLVEGFEKFASSPETNSHAWVFGNALGTLWHDERFNELASLATDASLGTARRMIVYEMRKSKKPEAVDVLISLVDDPDVGGHAISALARMKNPRAIPVLRKAVHHERAWVRKDAKKGLQRLGVDADGSEPAPRV